jgi:hypothetical protein
MLKFYKKYFFIPHYAQVILYLSTLVLGFFANRNWNYEESFYSILFPTIIFPTIAQVLVIFVLFKPVKEMMTNKLKKPKFSAGLISLIYLPLVFFYYVIFSIELSFWDIFSMNSSNVSTNTPGSILVVLWLIATFISTSLFLTSLIIIFIAPAYKSDKQLQQLISKSSKLAANKIRDLKKLLDEGIISKEVFDEKSKKYIEEL